MTRKDYVLLAGALKSVVSFNCKECGSPEVHYLHEPAAGCKDCKSPRDHHEFVGETPEVVRAVADALASDNPKFDRDHFLAVVRGEKSLTSKPAKSVRKTNQPPTSPDFSVRNEGSIYLLTPNSTDAIQWAADHLPDETRWFGNSAVVEHRYIQDIVRGIQNDGLTTDDGQGNRIYSL